MYKCISLIKRKPGMTLAQFKDYYEQHHSKVGDKYLPPYCVKYIRRYLEPIDHPLGGAVIEQEYDCLTELWFPDEATYRAFQKSVASPDIAKGIIEDESRFLDRTKTRRYLVEESLSWGPEQ